MEKSARYWIDQLKLVKQPNGLYTKEFYRSDETLRKDQLPFRYRHQRNFSSSHYVLAEAPFLIPFQRKKSDETWHFYTGVPAVFHIIDEEGNYSEKALGSDPGNGESLQILLRRGSWYAITLKMNEDYVLAACVSSPAASPEDVERGFKTEMNRILPHYKHIIEKFGE